MNWKVGDRIIYNNSVSRVIVAVRPGSGYDWKYPDMGEFTPIGERNLFRSEDSNDQFMLPTWGWELYGEKHKAAVRRWTESMETFIQEKR